MTDLKNINKLGCEIRQQMIVLLQGFLDCSEITGKQYSKLIDIVNDFSTLISLNKEENND